MKKSRQVGMSVLLLKHRSIWPFNGPSLTRTWHRCPYYSNVTFKFNELGIAFILTDGSNIIFKIHRIPQTDSYN